MNYERLRAAVEATGRMIPQGAGERVQVQLEYRMHPSLDAVAAYRHLRWMVAETLTWPDDGTGNGKLCRWLGFVQGSLWLAGRASIEDLRQINLCAGG